MSTSGETLRGLLLDLGGTLIHPEPPVAAQYRATAAELFPERSLPAEPLIRRRFRTAFHHVGPYPGLLRYGTTETEGFWFWKRMIGIVFPRLGDPFLQPLSEKLYERFRGPGAWRVRSGARSFLRRLRERDTATALVSNWDRRARELVGRLELTSLVDRLVISSEQGVEKPDPELFKRALGALDVEPSRTLMVGDSMPYDIRPAERLGLRVLYFTEDPDRSEDPGQPAADSWVEVAEYVAQRLG